MSGLLAAAIPALALAGCAAPGEPVPAACLGDPATIVQALERAPQAVALGDGTRLSTCVRRARSDGELQALGVTLVTVADTLRDRVASDPRAAAGLGYLAAAVRAGATANPAVASELARRIERATALEAGAPAAARAAMARGLRAGAGSG